MFNLDTNLLQVESDVWIEHLAELVQVNNKQFVCAEIHLTQKTPESESKVYCWQTAAVPNRMVISLRNMDTPHMKTSFRQELEDISITM